LKIQLMFQKRFLTSGLLDDGYDVLAHPRLMAVRLIGIELLGVPYWRCKVVQHIRYYLKTVCHEDVKQNNTALCVCFQKKYKKSFTCLPLSVGAVGSCYRFN